jgi:hypothetical protein
MKKKKPTKTKDVFKFGKVKELEGDAWLRKFKKRKIKM